MSSSGQNGRSGGNRHPGERRASPRVKVVRGIVCLKTAAGLVVSDLDNINLGGMAFRCAGGEPIAPLSRGADVLIMGDREGEDLFLLDVEGNMIEVEEAGGTASVLPVRRYRFAYGNLSPEQENLLKKYLIRELGNGNSSDEPSPGIPIA